MLEFGMRIESLHQISIDSHMISTYPYLKLPRYLRAPDALQQRDMGNGL